MADLIGMWELENLLSGVDGFTMALFTRVLGWSAEEVQEYLVGVRRDMKDTKIHAYWKM